MEGKYKNRPRETRPYLNARKRLGVCDSSLPRMHYAWYELRKLHYHDLNTPAVDSMFMIRINNLTCRNYSVRYDNTERSSISVMKLY